MVGAVRPARASDTGPLSELALQSKAHWGYDEAFLEACRDELTVTQKHIDDGEVWVIDDDSGPAGFYRLGVDGPEADVELLFVRPDAIGSGVGRVLWDHMIGEAARRGAERLNVDSDPGAEGFYRAMGCRRIGETPSVSIAGRALPHLELRLPKTANA